MLSVNTMQCTIFIFSGSKYVNNEDSRMKKQLRKLNLKASKNKDQETSR